MSILLSLALIAQLLLSPVAGAAQAGHPRRETIEQDFATVDH
jgi:hypothetical protein